ncbi:hypothetical protein DQ04_09381020 [Trypanosoma grayi]|uniref:hypothetical protein n=1 Tax=Trypanosoma grayi TaxID=71804 RepID=UPI0004F4B729|nr:hypothetical protein DQ04_09381020 [Trypanosoma grayi]KEG07576.1 hypothetical protein DQ04_09381020 [Trypanosoma grayi]
MPFQKASRKDDDYTPQELLTAAAVEYKKLEAANQTAIERMYGALSSPFKVSNKPCEVPRSAVLRCFEKMMGTVSNSSGGGGDGRTATSEDVANLTATAAVNGSNSGTDSSSSNDGSAPISSMSEFPPVHHCYEVVREYETCVLGKSLAQHNSLLAAFESRRLHEAEVSGEEATAARVAAPASGV